MSQSFRKSLSNQAYVGRVLACGKGDRFAVQGFSLCCTVGGYTERRWWSGPRGDRNSFCGVGLLLPLALAWVGLDLRQESGHIHRLLLVSLYTPRSAREESSRSSDS